MADDLADVIARLRAAMAQQPEAHAAVVSVATITKLLAAAEAGMRARDDVGFALSTPDVDVVRDAALEEAAAIVRQYRWQHTHPGWAVLNEGMASDIEDQRSPQRKVQHDPR